MINSTKRDLSQRILLIAAIRNRAAQMKNRQDAGMNVKRVFRSLVNRNCRLYLSGQFISMLGTWMQQLAISWLTYRLTQSPFMLGAIVFASMGPSVLLGPIAGVFPDIFNRHKLLITTQTLLMVQSFFLSWLTLRGDVQIWELMVLGAFAGVVNAVDMPTRQAFIHDMTENKEELGNIIALNSSQMNFTRILGPALAGAIVVFWGESSCFLLNTLSFLAFIGALLAMRTSAPARNPRNFKVLAQMREGFGYVASSLPIKFLLITTALASLAAVPYMVLLPVYAKTIFHGSAELLGCMLAVSSFGALLGTLLLAARPGVDGLAGWLVGSLFALSASLFIFAYSSNLAVSMLALALGGFGLITQMACSNTILQTIVEDDKRGRVMSLFMMAFLGIRPVGGLAAGYLGDRFGCSTVVVLSACLALTLALATLRFCLDGASRQARPAFCAD